MASPRMCLEYTSCTRLAAEIIALQCLFFSLALPQVSELLTLMM